MNQDNHLCFAFLERMGDHASRCSECGYEYLRHRILLHNDPKLLEEHKKHWPNCKDCKELTAPTQ